MKKLIRDGKVAVLYAPNYGAGWYTWHGVEELLFDPAVVEMVEQDPMGDVEEYCNKTYGDEHYYGGAEDLTVRWIPVGAKFRIDEYDGYESIILLDEEKYLIA